MKVIYKDSISLKLREAKKEAEQQCLEIEEVLLSHEEMESFCMELGFPNTGRMRYLGFMVREED